MSDRLLEVIDAREVLGKSLQFEVALFSAGVAETAESG
jgi:hypothetical protein